MMEEKFKIPLSGAQLAYLKGCAFLAPEQARVITTAIAFDASMHIAFVAHDVAEDFRNAFAGRYVAIGAGQTPGTEEESALLLDLIERFATE